MTQNEKGYNSLHHAAEKGSMDYAYFILQKAKKVGALQEMLEQKTLEKGFTPSQLALYKGNDPIAECVDLVVRLVNKNLATSDMKLLQGSYKKFLISNGLHAELFRNDFSTTLQTLKTERFYNDELFDYGTLSTSRSYDSLTHEPLFHLRLFRKSQEVGSVIFYGQPLFCRSEDGLRHNIIATSGIVSNLEIDPKTTEEICRVLPPTFLEKTGYYLSPLKPAIAHGVLRGSLEVASDALVKTGATTQNTANKIKTGLYWGGIFALNTSAHYQRSNQDGLADIYEAGYNATFDMGNLLFLMFALQLIVFLLRAAASMLSRNNPVANAVNTGSNLVGR